MIEMGYEVEHLAFYEISTNKTTPIDLPGEKGKIELISFIENFRNYNPTDMIVINPNKCLHCIYCNLCDKTDMENVYT
jgi:CRISPR-associated protein Cas4